MQPVTEKLVTIITEAVLEKELCVVLDKLGASGYTIADVRGRGRGGVRRSGWEHGDNIRIEVLCNEDFAAKLSKQMQEEYYDNFAMILFVSEVAVLRKGRF